MIAHHARSRAGHDDRHRSTETAATTARAVRATLWSLVSIVVAFLASQHHALHMLALTVGVGGTGAGFLVMFPTVRRLMLLRSLAMVGATLYQRGRHRPPLAVRALTLISATPTVGLLVWPSGAYIW